ncbi:MAG: tetratricopeptide repeat protein [Candidatus Sumerlaeota bacterium]|nr:tetratricopeptide repeat protein [Candidatus Sumerlaeota bacterium]
MRHNFKSDSHTAIFYAVLLAMIAGGVYFSSLHKSFVYRDGDYVVNNPDVQDIHNLPRLFTAFFPSGAQGQRFYRPLTSLSIMMDYLIWRTNPAGYGATSILLHMAATLLCFFLFLQMTGGEIGKAFFAALLFSLHPLHTENVASIAGRAETLGGIFFLAALLVGTAVHREDFLPSSGKVQAEDVRHSAGKRFSPNFLRRLPVFPILLALFYLLALLSHESAFMLPLVILLSDLLFRDEKRRDRKALIAHALRVYIPLLLVLIIYLVIRFMVSSTEISSTLPATHFSAIKKISLAPRLFTRYLSLTILPFQLSVIHGVEELPPLWISLVICVLFIIGVIVLRRRQPLISFSLGFFLLTMLPAIICASEDLMTEGTTYLATAGFCLALGAGVSSLIPLRDRLMDSGGGVAAMIIGLSLLSFYGVRTYNRNQDWSDSISLWRAECDVHPQSAISLNNLGASYYASGQVADAEASFRKAIEVAPDYYQSYHNLAQLFLDMKKRDEAEKVLDRAAKHGTDPEGANFATIGILYQELERPVTAQKMFAKALEVNQKNITALSELGNYAYERAQYEKCIEFLTRALSAAPARPMRAMLLSNRAMAYNNTGRQEQALSDLREALALNPKLAHPYLLIAEIEDKRKFPEKSTAILEQALKNIPDAPFEIYSALHQLYNQFNQPQKAFDILYEYQRRMPHDIRVQMAIGEFCLNWYLQNPSDKGKLATAATCFKNAVRLNPRNIRALIMYGKTAALAGEPDAAEKIWGQALKLEPENAEAKELLKNLGK